MLVSGGGIQLSFALRVDALLEGNFATGDRGGCKLENDNFVFGVAPSDSKKSRGPVEAEERPRRDVGVSGSCPYFGLLLTSGKEVAEGEATGVKEVRELAEGGGLVWVEEEGGVAGRERI